MIAAAPSPAPVGEARSGGDRHVGGRTRPPAGLFAPAAAAAAAVLALTSTGSMVVAAVLLAVTMADPRRALALVLAVASVAVRFAAVTFDDLAGIQSVLGAAGVVGPPTGAASAWLAAVAVLLAQRRRDGGGLRPTLTDGLVLVAGGALAATIVAGPGPSDLVLRVLATLGATAVAVAVTTLDRWRRMASVRPLLAVVVATGAVVAAAWPS